VIIIGEKINGAIPSVAKAIEGRDDAFIRDLAIRQSEYGANFIDVCAGTKPELERDALTWIIGIVQEAVDIPLCIDSPDPDVIMDMIPLVKVPGMINSVSNEADKCEKIFPQVVDKEWKIIALTCDDTGLAMKADKKTEIAEAIIEKAKATGISEDRLYIDPLVNSLGTTPESYVNFAEAVKMIKTKHPQLHFTSGLSNISFGMPLRKVLNQYFLPLAMAAGMDSAICDPTSQVIREGICATEALLGNDEFCVEFLQAFRAGLIG